MNPNCNTMKSVEIRLFLQIVEPQSLSSHCLNLFISNVAAHSANYLNHKASANTVLWEIVCEVDWPDAY